MNKRRNTIFIISAYERQAGAEEEINNFFDNAP